METKKCEYCKKEINFISNSMYDHLVIFCNDDHLLEYCKEYANDSDYEREPIDRNDLD